MERYHRLRDREVLERLVPLVSFALVRLLVVAPAAVIPKRHCPFAVPHE